MNCPTADKLSQFVDQLLPKKEMAEIEAHVQSCTSCEEVVNAFNEEQRFIEEALQTPTLPENFTDLVLDQLEPYGKAKKQRKAVWKRTALTAAGVVLAVGIGAIVNPAFAQFIGGLFSTDQVDDGLKIAAEAGLTQRVDLQVEDQGLTFVVEDIIADSSRVSLSYKVLNKNGKPQDTYLNISDSDNSIIAFDQNGEVLDRLGTGWQQGSDYGFIEFSLRDQEDIEHMTIQFDLVELDGVKGNWQLDVPVDLHENRKLTKMVDLKNSTVIRHGVQVDLKKLQSAPSSMELYFETTLTNEELKKSEEAMHEFGENFGKENIDSLVIGNTGIEYHIENATGETIYSTERSTDSGMLQRTGEDIDRIGGTSWIHSFIPKKGEQLTFVLDGIYKIEPTDFSIALRPKEIKKHPVSFDYKGMHLTVKSVKKPLFSNTPSVAIKLEGGMESLDADFGNWIAVDGEGNAYAANFSGSILDEKDKNGRHIATLDLELEGLQEVPEELTLHLVTIRNYYPVEDQWKVPLTGE
jgi:hypothetical protein